MKKLTTAITLLYCMVYLGSSLPYEPPVKPPVESRPFIYNERREPEKPSVPPRREVPQAYRSLFDAAAGSAGIPPGVLESIAFVESGFDPAAVSAMSANGRQDLGMFQFNSVYLSWYTETYNAGIAFDPLSPREAAMVAAKHIRFLYDRYGHWPTVFLAYNAGMAAVDADEIPDGSFRYMLKIYEDF